MKKINQVKQLHIDKKSFENLIKDFNSYFKLKNEIYNNWKMFNSIHWFKITDDLKNILLRYYEIEKTKDFVEFKNSNNIYYGSCINLNNKYINIFLKDIYTITIENAYPQRINNLIKENILKSKDNYILYVFYIIYEYVEKCDLKKFYINYIYGIFNSIKNNINTNLDIRFELSEYYNNLWQSIIKKNKFYYVNTDEIFIDKKQIKNISKVLEENNIKYIIEGPNDYIFLGKKRYIKFKNDCIEKIRGIKVNDKNYKIKN